MRCGTGAFCNGPSAGLSLPAELTYAGGARLWLDSDYSGGVADGATSFTPQNRVSGSNAVAAISSGGAGSITYRASKWRGQRVQSCWHLDRKAFRVTGSDIVNVAYGTGKLYTRYYVLVPRLTQSSAPGSAQYLGGWDTLAAGFPSSACGFLLTKNDRFTWSAYSGGSETAVDTRIIGQNAQILCAVRDTTSTVRFNINGVQGSPITYGSGTAYTPDGFTIGGWAGGGVANCLGDMFLRAVIVCEGAHTPTQQATVNAYLTSAYSGFENIATLGATATETIVFLGIGQSVEVGSQDSLVLDTYSTNSDVWLVGFNGITRPLLENAYDSTDQATGAINHASPDSPGQSSYGSMAARLRALGVTSRLLFAPAAKGSSSADNWNTGHADSPHTYQNIYGGAIKALREAMQAPNSVLGGILINQGEADAQVDAGTATAWGGKWDTICTDILAYAAAQGWSWKKTKRFFFTRIQNASTLAYKTQLQAAQDLLCNTTRSDCVLTQMPDASPPSIHPQADKEITHGTNRGTAWNAAS